MSNYLITNSKQYTKIYILEMKIHVQQFRQTFYVGYRIQIPFNIYYLFGPEMKLCNYKWDVDMLFVVILIFFC